MRFFVKKFQQQADEESFRVLPNLKVHMKRKKKYFNVKLLNF